MATTSQPAQDDRTRSAPGEERHSDRPPMALAVAVLVLATLSWLMLQPIDSELKAGIAIAMLFVLLAIRVPVAVALAVPGAFGMWAIRGWSAMAGTMMEVPFNSVSGWSLSVIPMFVFMGLMLWRSGATTDLYSAARQWIGWMPGGLAVTTNVTGAGLAAASGSTIGITYAIGRIAVPEMLSAGYHRRLSLAAVLMAGSGGQLIPPSIILVVYAGIAALPVGPQLLAGFVPGLILVTGYGLFIVGLSTVMPRLAPRATADDGEAPTWSGRWATARRVWPIPLLMLMVIGGIYAGVFTATEAGAVGAGTAMVVAAVYLGRADFWVALRQALRDTVASVGAIMFLLMGALFFNRFIVVSGAARWLSEWINEQGLGRVGFLLALIVLYLILGMFMDPIGMMLVTVPLLIPTLEVLDVDLIWFGIFVVLLAEVSILTPPVGILIYVVHNIVQDRDVSGGTDISLTDVFISALWFLPIAFVVLLVLIMFPDLALWLPETMNR